jgi:hypothetical protein
VTVQIGATTVQALGPHARDWRIDEPVSLVVRPEALYAFDPDTEATLHFARQGGDGAAVSAAAG